MNHRVALIRLTCWFTTFIFLAVCAVPAWAEHGRVGVGRALSHRLLLERPISFPDEVPHPDPREEAVNQEVDALAGLFEARRYFLAALLPDLELRTEDEEKSLNILESQIEALSEFVPQAEALLNDHGELEKALGRLQNDLAHLARDFKAAEKLLARLLEARAILNKARTSGQLERVRELAKATSAAFVRTNGVTTLLGRMEAIEAGTEKITGDVNELFFDFSRKREQEVDDFLTSRLGEVEALEDRIGQARAIRTPLVLRLNEIKNQIKSRPDLPERDQLLGRLDQMETGLEAIDELLARAEALVPDLVTSLTPLQVVLLMIKENSELVEKGILTFVGMLGNLEEARRLIEAFPGPGKLNPFEQLTDFSNAALVGALGDVSRELNDVQTALGGAAEGEPQSEFGTGTVTQATRFSTRFSIPALGYLAQDVRAREEIRKRLEETEPGIFGVNEFVTPRAATTEEEARALEAGSEARQRARRLLLVRDLTATDQTDVNVLDREPLDILIQMTEELPLEVEAPVRPT